MKITKFEQSGFIIESASGFRLAFDIGTYTPIEKLEGISCDAMLVSHIHGDHFSLEQIKKLAPKKLYLNHECIEALSEKSLDSEIVEVKVGDTVDIGDFHVSFFNVDHGPNISAPLAENFGFLITADGETLYFAGDMYNLSGIDVANLEVDYALIPIGGFYTFDPKNAFEFAKQFKKIGELIPMHYHNTNQTIFERLAKDSFTLKAL